MSFRSRFAYILGDSAADRTDAAPEPVYSYEIVPDVISDGEHEFDGVTVWFGKPGWQWVVYDNTSWPRVVAAGDGYSTRDEALLALLAHAKGMKNGSVEQGS